MYGNNVPEGEVRRYVQRLGIEAGFLDKPVGKNGMSLSGGQRQLVWCLRVFFKNPEILIMDEPTSSMDNESKDKLLAVLSDLMKRRTVIFVSHDPYLIKHAENKIYL
jgi:ABC-type bacteriocin/lantibiotic exporter with double-glycine peptidase domain